MAEGSGAIYLYNEYNSLYHYSRRRANQLSYLRSQVLDSGKYTEESKEIVDLTTRINNHLCDQATAYNSMVRLANIYRSCAAHHKAYGEAGEYGGDYEPR